MEINGNHEKESAGLNLLAEKVMHQPMKPDSVAYCPTMDLIALATVDEQVHVYRLNGQRVFGISNKKRGCRVDQLQWKPNGQILAIAFSDSTVSLISVQTGKIVQQISYREQTNTCICCLGWASNFTDMKNTKARLDRLPIGTRVDDIFSRGGRLYDADGPLDLPTDLAFLDIISSLPKLSVLPPMDRDDEVFSSRASVDAIFHSSNKDFNDFADLLLVGQEHGLIHLNIYDFFKVGSFEMRHSPTGIKTSKPLLHSSHPFCSTHTLLASSSSENDADLHLIPLDLRLLPETGRYLSLLAEKSTQLQNVLRYMREAQVQIYNEFRASQDLPRKFIRNIDEVLQEQNQCDFVTAAYHTTVTGHCFPCMKEWLVDELTERGQKRWEKAVATGYENIRRLVHENLLPAMQRFAVLVSRLRGLAKFQENMTNMGLSTAELDRVLDTLNCVQLLTRFILIAADNELHLFTAFALWLKIEIEVQATSLSSTEDTTDQDHMLDYPSILQYIQGPMQRSELIELFAIHPEADARKPWDPVSEDVEIYEPYKKELKAYIDRGTLSEKKFPGLEALLTRLDKQCKGVFDKIAEAQARKVKFRYPIRLGAGQTKSTDMRMVMEGGKDHTDECSAYVAIVLSNSQTFVRLYRVILEIVNGVSSVKTMKHSLISLPKRGTIIDIKFVDDETLMLAYTRDSPSTSYLLYVPYREQPESASGVRYTSTDRSASVDRAIELDLSKEKNWKLHLQHTFPEGPSWIPERLEVNGRTGRRAVCVIAQDRIHYQIFDIDTQKREGEVDSGGGTDVQQAATKDAAPF